MNKKIIGAIVYFILSLGINSNTLHAQYEIKAWVVGSGGGAIADHSHRVMSTV